MHRPQMHLRSTLALLTAVTGCALALPAGARAGHGGDHLERGFSQGDVSAVTIPGDGSYVDLRTVVLGSNPAQLVEGTVPIIYVAGDPAQSCQLSVELARDSTVLQTMYLVPPNATDIAYGSVHLSYRDASPPSGSYTYKLRAAAQSTCAGAAVEGIALLRVTRVDLAGDTTGGGGGSVAWADVTGKPATFPPDAHDHDDRYYTETESDARFAAAGSVGCGGLGQDPCVVAMGIGDRDRFDLMWWGVWALVGLVLVGLIANAWYSSWRTLEE